MLQWCGRVGYRLVNPDSLVSLDPDLVSAITLGAHLLLMINSCINPVIYNFMSGTLLCHRRRNQRYNRRGCRRRCNRDYWIRQALVFVTTPLCACQFKTSTPILSSCIIATNINTTTTTTIVIVITVVEQCGGPVLLCSMEMPLLPGLHAVYSCVVLRSRDIPLSDCDVHVAAIGL